MKKFTLIRPATYQYKIPGNNLYDSFNLLAKNQQEVEIDFVPAKSIDFDWGFCSERVRCFQTAALFLPPEKIVILPELNEVAYTMEEILARVDFLEGSPERVNAAREGFVRGLIADKLSEKYFDLMERIERLLAILGAVEAENVLVVTHGFYLKVVEAVIKDPTVKQKPENLWKYFDGKTETYNFAGGFVVEEDSAVLRFLGYGQL